MTHAIFLDAGPVTFDATFFVELAAFLLMLAFLNYVPLPFLGIPKPVFKWIQDVAEDRQRTISEQLEAAEKARKDSEAMLKEATAKLDEARKTAQTVIDGASRSAESVRKELREKAEEEARRVTEGARKEIEAERKKAIESVRSQVAELVIGATEKIIGETLDADRHRKLIDDAIEQVGSAQR